MGWSCHSNGPAMTCKKILIAKPEGRRKRKGRPKLRWEDGVDNDVKALGKGNWKNIARHSQEQKNVTESSKEGCGSKEAVLLLLLMMMVMKIQSGQMDEL
jgi:hypothetical protein